MTWPPALKNAWRKADSIIAGSSRQSSGVNTAPAGATRPGASVSALMGVASSARAPSDRSRACISATDASSPAQTAPERTSAASGAAMQAARAGQASRAAMNSSK